MTRFILTTASAALLAGASALPALSQEADLNTMSCADFRALGEQEQVEVAAAAIAEQEGGGESLRDSATAGETDSASGETTEAEADGSADTTAVDNEGTATATDGGDDMERESVMEADMEALMRACDRNLNAMVLEAAAGMDTSR